MRYPLVGQSYTARSATAAAASLINLYAEQNEDPENKAKGIGALYGCPGRTSFKVLTTIDAAATPVRGIWSGGGRLFVAAGTKYFEIDKDTGALIGSVRTIADDATHTPVQFFSNGNQLFIVSAGVAYCDNGAGPVTITLGSLSGLCTTTGVIVILNSGDFFDAALMNGRPIVITGVTYTVLGVTGPGTLVLTSSAGVQVGTTWSFAQTMSARTGAFLDGYFIANLVNSRQISISPLYNGLGDAGAGAWGGLDFAIKESYPDYINGILVANEQLYLFGTETGEVWQNTGAANFPFARIDGATFNVGTVSPWSPIEIVGNVYFLGTNSEGQITAYVMNGFTPVRISTYAEEAAWTGVAPTTAYSYGYVEDGHAFWVFHIGTQCWHYDINGPVGLKWAQRNAWSGSAFTVYPTYYHTFIAEANSNVGRHITGGNLNGTLYESSVNLYSDAGSDIKCQRALPYRYSGGLRIYFKRMALEMQTGTVPSGAAPNISRDYSDDRGNTFSTPQAASMGVHDDFSLRVFWAVGGSCRESRIWRLSITGQSKVALVDLHCDEIVGAD